MSKVVLSILVNNTSGVLSRVAGLFSRRGYNIDSLTVGETEDPAFSRMTVSVTRRDFHLYGRAFVFARGAETNRLRREYAGNQNPADLLFGLV